MILLRLLICSLCLLSIETNAIQVVRHQETASGADGWRLLGEHIKIELNPLYRDQVRAFYIGRGFSESVSEQLAQLCVFQAVIQNISPADEAVLVDVDLADWRIVGDEGVEHALASKASRMKALEAAGASQAALLAFKWATFPEQQDFKLSGDYGWGMILFGERPAGSFNLRVQWRAGGETRIHTLKNLDCLGEAPANES